MNAIILAAGLGSRLKEITKNKHKALLPVDNIPNIERTILYLHEAGIKDIFIVTGYLKEQFDYLKDKYNCNLIYNDKFSEYNNVYSFYLAKDYFLDTYVIDSDVILTRNIFLEKLNRSSYFVIKRPISEDNEWIPECDNNDRVINMKISNDVKASLLGVSYWNKQDASKIKEKLEKYNSKDNLTNSKLYWDNIPISMLDDLNIGVFNLNENDAFEVDKLEHYKFAIKNIESRGQS